MDIIDIHKHDTCFKVTGCKCTETDCPVNWFPRWIPYG